MHYEVEQKFRVNDLAAIERELAARGASVGAPFEQIDRYFRHPARDFAETDEALRLRQTANRHRITYKGPRIDATTKTRRELELPLPDDARTLDSFTQLLVALGFSVVADVRKSRRKAELAWQERCVEVSLDEVDGVGSFLELELTADDAGLDEARGRILSLAAALGLADSERRSYLELLLDARSRSSG